MPTQSSSKNLLSVMAAFLWRKDVLILAFVLVLTFISFYPSLWGELTNWDDRILVTDNPEIRALDWGHIKTIFTSTASHGYIPLTIFSFNIEYHFFGLNPFVFHLDNLILHLVVTALVFCLGFRLGLDVWACGLAALLFGIHPMRVESVAWIAERKDGLYAVFYMLALHSHWTYLETGRKRSYTATFLYGLLSMLAKPMALSLPLVLLLLDGMKGRRMTVKMFLEKLPHFLYIIPVVILTLRIHMHPNHESFLGSLLTWVWCSVFYIWKFLFPLELVPLYARPEPVSFGNPVYLAAILSWVVIVLIVIRFRAHRWLIFAMLFYFLSIFFLFRFNILDISVVADRYMYLPSVGFCFLFGLLVQQVLVRLGKGWKAVAVSGLLILFGLLGAKTFAQCRIWKDSQTVFSAMVNHNPDNWVSFYNRGRSYEYEGKDALAEADYTKCILLNPNHVLAHSNRAGIFSRQGRAENALRDYSRALEIDPQFAAGYYNRARVYSQLKQYDLALADLNKSLQLDSKLALAYAARGLVYARLKRFDVAMEDYNHGLKIDPSLALLYYLRSRAYAHERQFDVAHQDAVKAKMLGHSNMDVYIDQLQKQIDSTSTTH